MRREIRADGLDVVVAAPPTVARGSMRGVRAGLRVERATCLERSLVVQRWWATNGVALDVIVGIRHPDRTDGDMAHAWVEHYDADCSEQYGEIRRVTAPGGQPPRLRSPARSAAD